MALKLFNTITQRKEDFDPVEPARVRIYSCGPTVYNFNHLGNFRAYVFIDVLRRYLRARGYGLEHAMNSTDVEDKIIANASAAGRTLEEFTEPYITAFLEDLSFLNIEEVEHRPKATASIPGMLDLMRRLDEAGHSYRADGNLYFRLSSFRDYGRLARLNADHLRAAADGRFEADEYSKEDVRDFALWKATEPGEPGWDSPWGRGRPGWHLECSAMIRDIFGSGGIDIHTGGVDLVFPHHENEIAQSCCAFPADNFVHTWLHNEHLLVDGKKMSKSLGNYFMLRDFSEMERLESAVEAGTIPVFVLELARKGRLARAMRYLLMSFHYRTKLNFTFDNLRAADSACERLQNLVHRLLKMALSDDSPPPDEAPGVAGSFLLKLPEPTAKHARAYLEAMDDDLNTARAVGILFDFARDVNMRLEAGQLSRAALEGAVAFLRYADVVLGVLSFEVPGKEDESPDALDEEIRQRIEERLAARRDRAFADADRIRDELLARGIRLVDTPDGTTWERTST